MCIYSQSEYNCFLKAFYFISIVKINFRHFKNCQIFLSWILKCHISVFIGFLINLEYSNIEIMPTLNLLWQICNWPGEFLKLFSHITLICNKYLILFDISPLFEILCKFCTVHKTKRIGTLFSMTLCTDNVRSDIKKKYVFLHIFSHSSTFAICTYFE